MAEDASAAVPVILSCLGDLGSDWSVGVEVTAATVRFPLSLVIRLLQDQGYARSDQRDGQDEDLSPQLASSIADARAEGKRNRMRAWGALLSAAVAMHRPALFKACLLDPLTAVSLASPDSPDTNGFCDRLLGKVADASPEFCAGLATIATGRGQYDPTARAAATRILGYVEREAARAIDVALHILEQECDQTDLAKNAFCFCEPVVRPMAARTVARLAAMGGVPGHRRSRLVQALRDHIERCVPGDTLASAAQAPIASPCIAALRQLEPPEEVAALLLHVLVGLKTCVEYKPRFLREVAETIGQVSQGVEDVLLRVIALLPRLLDWEDVDYLVGAISRHASRTERVVVALGRFLREAAQETNSLLDPPLDFDVIRIDLGSDQASQQGLQTFDRIRRLYNIFNTAAKTARALAERPASVQVVLTDLVETACSLQYPQGRFSADTLRPTIQSALHEALQAIDKTADPKTIQLKIALILAQSRTKQRPMDQFNLLARDERFMAFLWNDAQWLLSRKGRRCDLAELVQTALSYVFEIVRRPSFGVASSKHAQFPGLLQAVRRSALEKAHAQITGEGRAGASATRTFTELGTDCGGRAESWLAASDDPMQASSGPSELEILACLEQRLGEKEFRFIELRLQGFKDDEIADLLETTRNLTCQARKKAREALQQAFEDELGWLNHPKRKRARR
ncbi:MAG TPA: hypothetical protein VEL76_02460 [Gemmataceae bacterium]|nr:hypothetical protein [Gemmataceae bacterium]